MQLAELMPVLRSLPRSEKLEVVRELAFDLADEEWKLARLLPPGNYEVWSPLEAYGAATALEELLKPSPAQP